MSEPIVSIDQGFLKGKTGTDINGRTYFAFLGIPYAKPPIGELRFKAPEPPEKWIGVRDATKDGEPCYSRDFILLTVVGSEDCLFLNVYTPELSRESSYLKPVMVYIHGGGYATGSNTSEMYGPEFLLTEDIVLVTINYRLGLLGFLQLDDSEVDVPGNAGCKDMVMALKWVQSNIRQFGGDPDNVTIFGQSAGGASVHLLMLSPMGKGLFHKAIAQSGCALAPWAMKSRPSTEDLLKAVECPYSDGKDILRYLQELRVEKILEAQEKMPAEFSADSYLAAGPVIEKITSPDAFLSKEPLDIIQNGSYNKVPLMIGYTTHEGLIFEMLEQKIKKSQVVVDFEKMIPNFLKLERGSELSKSLANKIKTFYFGDEIPSRENVEKSNLIQADNLFVHSIWRSVKSHLLYSDLPIYVYRFSLDEGLNFFKKCLNLKGSGAAHCDELGYLFKMPIPGADFTENSIEMKSVRRMVKLWTNFAKTGDPNPIENIVWKPLSKNEMNVLTIGKELICSANPDHERMIFWDGILYDAYKNLEHVQI